LEGLKIGYPPKLKSFFYRENIITNMTNHHLNIFHDAFEMQKYEGEFPYTNPHKDRKVNPTKMMISIGDFLESGIIE
jgi:hypothetical protein